MNIANKPPLGQKQERHGPDPLHLARVKRLPCCICEEFEMRQNSPTEVHHVKSGRYSTRRAPDSMTIPLCHSHHNKLTPHPGDENKVGFHNAQATWESMYGEDTEWLNWVTARLEGEL